MKPLLYADRQVLRILASRAFEQKDDGRWYFEADRSIADSVAQRLIAHGVAKKIGDHLVWKAPKPKRRRRREPVATVEVAAP